MIFPLKAPGRAIPQALGVAFVASVLISLLSWDVVLSLGGGWEHALGLAAMFFVVFAATLIALQRRQVPVQIVIQSAGVSLPIGFSGGRSIEVPFDQIDLLFLVPRSIVIGSSRRRFTYPIDAFSDADGATRLHEELRARINSLPGGIEQLRAIDREAAAARTVIAGPATISKVIVAVLVLIFIAELAGGLAQDPFVLVRFGAASRALTAGGELYRIVSAGFLHASLLHIALNCVAILSIGGLIERLLGRSAFTAVYLISAIGGAGASVALSGAAFSVGASTAAFGLLGALAYVSVQFRNAMPAVVKQPLLWWLLIISVNFALPVWIPVIDVAGHAGGFVCGLLVTGALVGSEKVLPLARPNAPSRSIAAAVSTGMTVVGLHFAVDGWLHPDPSATYRALDPVIGEREIGSTALNRYAWDIAIDPGADSAWLGRARSAAERAMLEASNEANELPIQPEQRTRVIEAMRAAYGDTLATVEYRLGELDRAIAREREILEKNDRTREDTVFATQLARFVVAAHRRHGEAPVRVSIIPGGVSWELDAKTASKGSQIIYVAAERRGILAGLVRAPLTSGGARTGTVAIELPWSDVKLDAAVIFEGRGPPAAWTADPQILVLP